MATVVHARQLAAADKEKQGDDEDEMDAPSTRPSTLYAGKTLRATPGLYAKVPVQPAAHPARLLTRPGMGRQMSSVSNFIDAYTSRSASDGGSSHRNSASASTSSSSAPNSPSANRTFNAQRSLYQSQVVTRRSSMQVPGSPRASTTELSALVRERRPSAPEIHSPPARLMDGINNSATGKGQNHVASAFDMKRLRSKPAPPQQVQHHQQSSSSIGIPEERQNAPWSTAKAGGTDDQAGSFAREPKEQHDSLVSPLTTTLFTTQLLSQASTPTKLHDSTKSRDNDRLTMSLPVEHQVGPSSSTASNSSYSNHNNNSQTYAPGESYSQPQYSRSESNRSDRQRHVDSSSGLQQQQYYASGWSRRDISTSSSDTGTIQQAILAPTPRAPSPQTPRKIRNSSLPMGTSPSLSSPPTAGRQSPTSRRPLKLIAPTSSAYENSYPQSWNQPALPPSPRSKTDFENETYQSILPTSTSFRKNRQASIEGFFVTSPPSSSSEVMTSPEQALPHMGASPTKSKKERHLAAISSPVVFTHKKLVRKQSRGHVRKDSGSSHAHGSSSSTVHSRSLSLPRATSRGSTAGTGTGSGSGSEQDDLTSITSSQSHFFTQRPAWLDQDPNATFPSLPVTNMSSRMKSQQQQYPPLYQQHNNRSLNSLNQLSGQPIFGPSSLPSTSTLLTSQMEASLAAASLPKRKTSFYRRKRSQTAIGVPDEQVTDSNGFPMPSPMSEIVKNMPLHGRMSHDVLHHPPTLPSKRNVSTGGFLSSITRKLSHPNIKDQAPHFEIIPMPLDPSPGYFSGIYAPPPPPPDKPITQQTQSQNNNANNHSSPKLGEGKTSRSWLHPFHHNDQSKTDTKALPQLPTTSSGRTIYSDPFSASSTISLPGFLHRSPRKDSLSSDKSEASNGLRRRGSRSRTISQDGDSSDGHSSELGYPSRGYDPAPPVPEVPVGMRNRAGSPPSTSTLPKGSKKVVGLLRSPSLGQRSKKTVPELDLSPTTPRAGLFNNGTSSDELPSPTRAGMLVINKANESLNSARRSGLSANLTGVNGFSDSPAPNILGSFAAMDKITAIENDIKEARFMALMDRSARADQGVIKLSLASTAARDAGIA